MGTWLQPSRAALGPGRAWGCLQQWGPPRGCRGACADAWEPLGTERAVGQRWGGDKEGWWRGQGWPGLGSGETGHPGCSGHPTVLGADPRVTGRARLRAVGSVPWDGAVGAPRAGGPLALQCWEAAQGQPRRLELNWDARALTPHPGSGGLGWG